MKIRCLPYLLLFSSLFVVAQDLPHPEERNLPAGWEVAIMVRQAQIYLSPDTNSTRLAQTERGREVTITEKSGNQWLHVQADIGPEKQVSGWIIDKGVVRASTPNGDQILFGEAASSELEASRRGGRKGAADDARRLYYRVYNIFPNSPLAGEGLYRAADIIWQVEAEDVHSRPSAKMRDPGLHAQIDDTYMRLVMKKFPNTKWADLAAFHLIDNKLCGNWEGLAKCPEKEADIYEKYAQERPTSPAAPEALYRAGQRRAALMEIYRNDNKQKEIEKSRAAAKSDCELLINKYAQTDWAYRARSLQYMIDQNIPTYGTAIE